MTKSFFLLSILLSLLVAKVSAQVFTQGDVTVTVIPSGTHDSTTCATQFNMFYSITIQNSFVGDDVTVKDMFGGFIIYQTTNSTGQNPWYVMVPVTNAFGIVSDDQVSGGYAMYAGPSNKVISGTDTVFNIFNFNQVAVPAPCLYGNVSGKIYVDQNNDCIFNGNDIALNSVSAVASEALNSPSMTLVTDYGYSNSNGDYNMRAVQTWMTGYTVSISPVYQFIFPLSACTPPSYSFTTLPQANVDFSLQCTSNMDVQCWAGSQGIVRPNHPFLLFPYVSNTGCDSASGTLKLVLDANVIYNAGLSSNPANTVSGDTLIWNYTGLTSLSNGAYWNSFMAGVYLTPTVGVSVGDTLCFRVFTNVPSGDVDPTNNDYSFCLPVVNSYDPNLKEVNPKGIGPAGDIPVLTQELTYTIHFQNTGTAVAYNIAIIDTLDTDLDATSLKILGTSHAASPQWIAPGVVRFDFSNIYLADSTTNEPASHGFIRFSVKLGNTSPLTVFQNKASIYFDSNPAIVTNTVTNTLDFPEGINEATGLNGKILVNPNPMNENTTFTIQPYNTTEVYSFELTDVLGKTMKTIKNINSKQFNVERSGLGEGIYFYKIYSKQGVTGTGKIVIQ